MSDTAPQSRTSAALLALLLLVPAPTIGTALAMVFEPTRGTWIGQGAYGLSKVWILAVPLVWLKFVERGRLSWSPPRQGGLRIGAITGIVISSLILLAYTTFGRGLLDVDALRDAVEANGIGEPARYIALALYLSFVNALLEEYVWRWFVFRQCERLVGGAGGVLLSAAFFTLHHIVALAAQVDAAVTILGSIGVFLGGAIWSTLYRRYRSVWPAYFSHLTVDLTILLVIGYPLIF